MTSIDPPAPFSRQPDVPGIAAPQPFDRHGVAALRDAVAADAATLGVPPDLVQRLLIVTSELTTNAVRHGGGGGWLRLWRDQASLYLEVTDHGPGLTDPTVGTQCPEPTAIGGRGIWMCHQLTRDLRNATNTNGTNVQATFDLANQDHAATKLPLG
jgi:anti-sigma regulatory factor (Ser/Thr protein kinase)